MLLLLLFSCLGPVKERCLAARGCGSLRLNNRRGAPGRHAEPTSSDGWYGRLLQQLNDTQPASLFKDLVQQVLRQLLEGQRLGEDQRGGDQQRRDVLRLERDQLAPLRAHILEHRQDDAAPHGALRSLLISQLLFRTRYYRELLRTRKLLLVELVTHEAVAGPRLAESTDSQRACRTSPGSRRGGG